MLGAVRHHKSAPAVPLPPVAELEASDLLKPPVPAKASVPVLVAPLAMAFVRPGMGWPYGTLRRKEIRPRPLKDTTLPPIVEGGALVHPRPAMPVTAPAPTCMAPRAVSAVRDVAHSSAALRGRPALP